MPAVLLERIPLPSLQFYTTVTTFLLASAVFYAHQRVTTITEPQTNTAIIDNEDGVSFVPLQAWNHSLPYDTYGKNVLFVITTETWCVWTLVNTAYCGLILVGKVIQKLVFGDLRVSEQQHLKDKFWNFVFYKFIFIFGVMNVQTMEEVVLWVAWFSVLGFFHLLTQLCKDRFEYLSFSPMTPRLSHVKLLSLLFAILLSGCGLLVVCVYTGLEAGLTILAFMGAECLLLGLRTLYVLVRYFIHLWDMSKEGVWENRSIYIYFTELVFELAALAIDFCHHLHMLLWGNIFLSMASLVICMQLRYLFYEFQRRVKRHKNYLRVVKNMEAKFPMAMQEDIEKNADDCAICWEKMESARKLPCSHLFHNSCLRSWLEQDTSCPTCRMSLSDDPSSNDQATPDGGDNNVPPAPAAPNQGTVNHFFHFDGSRYVSWLPSFSVEVTHTNLLPGQQTHVQTSQLDNMARQVQQVFPNMPLTTILDDLRVTRSVDLTIDSILDGRLPILAPPATVNRTVSREDDFENSGEAQNLQVQEMHLPTTVSKTGAMGLRSLFAERNQAEENKSVEASASTSCSLVKDLSSASSTQIESDDNPSASGGRFSKSASERMSMLQQRKNVMLEQARRKYLNRDKRYLDSQTEDIASMRHATGSEELIDTTSDRSRQREVMFQAVQRRLQHTPSTDS